MYLNHNTLFEQHYNAGMTLPSNPAKYGCANASMAKIRSAGLKRKQRYNQNSLLKYLFQQVKPMELPLANRKRLH